MDQQRLAELTAASEPATLGRYLAGLAEHAHGHAHPAEPHLREDHYQGHHIAIQTSYQITVDGKPLTCPFSLSDQGELHTHALPTLEFGSVVDMVRALIDCFPGDFEGNGGGHGDSGTHSRRRV